MHNWLKRRPLPRNLPHPNSPAGRTFDWSSLGVPHPNSPASLTFDWLSVGVAHPNSSVGRSFVFPSLDFQESMRVNSTVEDRELTVAASASELKSIKAEICRSIRGHKAICSAEALRSLFKRAVPLMDFSTGWNEGVLYSGKKGEFGTGLLADVYAKQSQKKLIAATTDGEWLNNWEPLPDLVGEESAVEIWLAASIRYVSFLKGDVVVFLANQEFERVFRHKGEGEQRALYKNVRVKRILYVIEHAAPNFDGPKPAENGRAWFFPSVRHLEDFLRFNPSEPAMKCLFYESKLPVCRHLSK